MNPRKAIAVVGTALLCLFLLGWGVHGQKKDSTSKQNWEYKYLYKYYSIDNLNALGAEGWELVGVSIDSSDNMHFYFKRAK
jgi:hypothetical protein